MASACHTPQQPPVQDCVRFAFDRGPAFASEECAGRLRGPRSWQGARSGGVSGGTSGISGSSGDLTTEALIGAFIGGVSALEAGRAPRCEC